ncbi:hypothetical protein AB1Y20_015854 [Prymnesium parvum]|uniref:Cation efflux protein cytoplasmic domain-containing protein n=1 Tax=Prymnesium parvum TaxID=97485 RepID=A0AB34JZ32_PRYPA
MRTAIRCMLFLAASAAALHQPAALHLSTPRRARAPLAHAPASRKRDREPVQIELHGVRPLLGSCKRYLKEEVMRPIVVQTLVFASALQRHAHARSHLTAASSDGAARITWIGALINLLLSGFKLLAGIHGHSAAMISDAGHSLSDLVSDGLTLLAIRMANLPPDVDHPYGHGRFESVGSLAIGGLLWGAGMSFAISSYSALRHPSTTPMGMIALWAAVASIVSKEVLYRATLTLGERLKSQILVANAWHHRSDALSSVVALVGIGGSMMGWRRLDPIAGMVVAALVAWMGLRIGVEALLQLTDTTDYAMVKEVTEVASRVEGVQGVDQVRCRSMGGSSHVDLAIQVDQMISASSAHRIAEEVRWSISKECEDVSEVLVHVDTGPHDMSCPLQDRTVQQYRPPSQVEEEVRELLLQQPEICRVPHVQVHYLAEGVKVDAYLSMAGDPRASESREVAERVRRRLLDNATDIQAIRIGLALTREEDSSGESVSWEMPVQQSGSGN